MIHGAEEKTRTRSTLGRDAVEAPEIGPVKNARDAARSAEQGRQRNSWAMVKAMDEIISMPPQAAKASYEIEWAEPAFSGAGRQWVKPLDDFNAVEQAALCGGAGARTRDKGDFMLPSHQV